MAKKVKTAKPKIKADVQEKNYDVNVGKETQTSEENIIVVVKPKRTIQSLSRDELRNYQRTGVMPK